jgi:hypothetical protein
MQAINADTNVVREMTTTAAPHERDEMEKEIIVRVSLGPVLYIIKNHLT